MDLKSTKRTLARLTQWLLFMLMSMLLLMIVWRWLPINHNSIGALLCFQAVQAIAVFIVPALTLPRFWGEDPLQWLHLARTCNAPVCAIPNSTTTADSRWRLDGQLVLLSIGIILCAIPLINCLVAWNKQIRLPESMSALEQALKWIEEQAELMLQGFMTYRNGAWWVLLINLFVLAVLPAIGEELAFRGVLQSFFRNKHVAVWVTAIIFSFAHFQFYGFIPRMLIGALLGYALVWSNRIGYSMIMHATNNALSVLVFYLGTYAWQLSQEEMDSLGTAQTWWLTLICTPLMAYMMFLFYRRAKTISE